KNYDPQHAIKLWWEGATRHTNYKEGRTMRSKKSTKVNNRVQQKDEEVETVEVEAEDVEANKLEAEQMHAVENVAAEIVPSNDTDDDDDDDDDEGFDELSLRDDDEYELSEKQVNDNMKNIIAIMDKDDDL
ncbi:unnamed protein product, partial [Owenia fusiformis]